MKKISFLSLMFTIMVNFLYAQWKHINGPYYRGVSCFASLDTTLFAGTIRGVFKSNNGDTWTNTGLSNVSFLTIGGNNIFACVDGSPGMHFSIDSGNTWVQNNNGLPPIITSGYFKSLVVAGSKIFLSSNTQIYSATVNGSNWSPVTFPSGAATNFLCSNGTDLFLPKNNGVYKSNNGGISWSYQIWPILSGKSIDYIKVIGSTILVSTKSSGTNTGVFLSINSGATWIKDSIGLPSSFYGSAFSTFGSQMFFGVYGNTSSLFSSSDSGKTWSIIPQLMHQTVLAMAVVGSNIFSGTGQHGLFKSTNQGINWIATGIEYSSSGNLSMCGSIIFSGNNANYGGDGYYSLDDGNSWSIYKQFNSDFINNYPNDSILVYITNTPAPNSQPTIHHSANCGSSWDSSSTVFAPNTRFYCFAKSGSNYYLGSSNSVYVSNDNGNTWLAYSIGLPPFCNIQSLVITSSKILAGTNRGIYSSINNGISWFPDTLGMGVQEVNCFAINGTSIFAGTDNGGIYLSLNNGTNWTQKNSGLPNISNSFINDIAISGSNTFIATDLFGIFFSDNNGNNWTAVNEGLLDTSATTILIVDSNVFAGVMGGTTFNGRGIYKRALSNFYVSVSELNPNNSIVVFPNPVKTILNIQLSETIRGKATFQIYDVVGREIFSDASWFTDNNTLKQIYFSNFASGIYFLRIKMESGFIVKKFLKD